MHTNAALGALRPKISLSDVGSMAYFITKQQLDPCFQIGRTTCFVNGFISSCKEPTRGRCTTIILQNVLLLIIVKVLMDRHE
jgi:hypothetical protein